MVIANRRQSKYAGGVRQCLVRLGHASNAQIIEYCRKTHPSVSPTTIHRITQRMHDDGEISIAPNTLRGERRYDINVLPHDHFNCVICDKLLDIDYTTGCRQDLAASLGDCRLDGPLTISGKCGKCIK